MSTPALPEESEAALTESQRLLYTFTAPAKTMADLRRNASWWVPWLLVSIVSVGFAYTLDKKIGWAQAIETQIQANPKAAAQIEQQPPEQREKAMKTQAAVASVIGYAAPLMTLLALVMIGRCAAGDIQLWLRREITLWRNDGRGGLQLAAVDPQYLADYHSHASGGAGHL